MPRPNKGRQIEAEVNLARRIAVERKRRDLSYEGLAKLLGDAGCPIAGSAIYKIENGEPPRRVTVDELVALSHVFKVPVDELLLPMELLNQRRAQELIARLRDLDGRFVALAEDMFATQVELMEVTREDDELGDYVWGHWGQSFIESYGRIEVPGRVKSAFVELLRAIQNAALARAYDGLPVDMDAALDEADEALKEGEQD